MRGEFSALRAEVRGADEGVLRVVREESRDAAGALRVHEDVISKIALINEGHRPRKPRK
jgi:hypothetical protein